MSTFEIDLNADLGEGFGPGWTGEDEALLEVVSSANVACGFHAGDPSIMRRVCTVAAERGVAVGAHVSYRDLAGFGRRYIAVPPAELSDEIAYQIGALMGIAAAAGTRVRYVKAHGALYNRAHSDPDHAGALIDAIAAYGLPVLCQPGSTAAEMAAAAGIPVVHEAFADRGYLPSGALVPRSEPGAVLDDPAEVAERAVRMARDREVHTFEGEPIPLHAQSLCVHGDSPNAVAMVRAVRSALESTGIQVRPFA